MVFISASNELGAFESGASPHYSATVQPSSLGGVAHDRVRSLVDEALPRARPPGPARGSPSPSRLESPDGAPRPLDHLAVHETAKPGEFLYSRFDNPAGVAAEAALGELEGGTRSCSRRARPRRPRPRCRWSGPARPSPWRKAPTTEPPSLRRARSRGDCASSSSTRPARRPRLPTSSGSRRRPIRSSPCRTWKRPPPTPLPCSWTRRRPPPSSSGRSSTARTSSCTARRSTSEATTMRCSARWLRDRAQRTRAAHLPRPDRHRRRARHGLARAARTEDAGGARPPADRERRLLAERLGRIRRSRPSAIPASAGCCPSTSRMPRRREGGDVDTRDRKRHQPRRRRLGARDPLPLGGRPRPPENLIRLSVGPGGPETLWADLEQALA